MPQPAIATPLLATDPGFLFIAPLGTAEPTHAVTASVFSDVWAAGWVRIGATEDGSNFSFQTTTEQITVAESLDVQKYIETGRTGSIAFAMADFTLSNLKRALNGGTIVTTGATTTSMSVYTPPALGASVRQMVGWESTDGTERLICYQCFSSGQLQVGRRKGAAKATLAVEFNLETPAGGVPFKHIVAGVARLGA